MPKLFEIHSIYSYFLSIKFVLSTEWKVYILKSRTKTINTKNIYHIVFFLLIYVNCNRNFLITLRQTYGNSNKQVRQTDYDILKIIIYTVQQLFFQSHWNVWIHNIEILYSNADDNLRSVFEISHNSWIKLKNPRLKNYGDTNSSSYEPMLLYTLLDLI